MENLTEGAHFDKDAQGFRRVVAHGDEWMHSRLIHDGVEQRIRVEVRRCSNKQGVAVFRRKYTMQIRLCVKLSGLTARLKQNMLILSVL